ncbi:MAG: helix-turn-helix transcriptional regulator [Phaeodactylibacter sp.]|nr:helix-turn-helix transcriptional regulator [Phaeodactylibacter sp.]
MRKYNRIKAVLADKGKTAKWLAKEVGRDRSTVSRWCTNDMQPPVEVLFQVAELLAVDVCDLLVRDQRNDATP